MKNKFLLIVILFFSIFAYSQTSEQDCETARKQYLLQNPDVAKAGMNAWSHYISYGKREGRKWPVCNNDSSSNEVKIINEFNVIESNENLKEFIFDNGDKYRGEYNDEGIMHGNGTYTFKNGNIYVGELKMGVFEGKGKLIYKNGDFYEGNWLDDNKEGEGKFTYANGNIYEGNFRLGYMEGKGKLSISNGNIYIGEFEKNKMSGFGKYYYKSGEIYEGQFKDDKINGQGTFSGNGYKCEANFLDGEMSGYGKITYSDGSFYEGNFLHSKRSGIGKQYFESGAIYEGQFRDDKFNGQGSFSAANGDKYIGNFLDDRMSGYGKYYYKSGAIYEGQFKEDKFNGQGTLSANGDKYIGNFLDGKMSGYGKFLTKEGTSMEGIWANNILVNDYNKVETTPVVQSSNSSNNQSLGNVFDIYQKAMDKALNDNPTLGSYRPELSTSGTNINGERCKKCNIILRTPKNRACYICNRNFSGWGFVKKDYGITSEHEELQSPCFPISGIHNYKGWAIKKTACCSRKCATNL